MAETVKVRTKPLTRDVLSDVTKGNARAIKALEDLTLDVQTTLPDAINQSISQIDALAQGSGQSLEALGEANRALALAALSAVDSLNGQLAELRELVVSLYAVVQELKQMKADPDSPEQVAVLLSTVNDLKQGVQL